MAKSTSPITIMLREKGYTGGKIAHQLNVKPCVVYHTIRSTKNATSQRVRLHIALLLGRTPSYLWRGSLAEDVLLVDDKHYMDMLSNKSTK